MPPLMLILPALFSGLAGYLFVLQIPQKLKYILSLMLQLATFVFVCFGVLLFKNGVEISKFYIFNDHFNIANSASFVVFFADKYSFYFALLISFLAIPSGIYAVIYMNEIYKNKSRQINSFLCFYHLCIASALLCAVAGNLFTMFICYEMISLLTIPLICFGKNLQTKKNVVVYAVTLLGLSSLLLLPSILIGIFNFNLSNFFDLSENNKFIISKNHNLLAILFAMMIFGVAKSAVLPFFAWLPRAMVAPTPVSALLHAVAVVKVGVFFVLRIVNNVFSVQGLSMLSVLGFFYGKWLFYIACVMIVISSSYAFLQTNFKKMLAYSTVSQLGYIILSLSTFTEGSVDVAFLQIVAHALAKIVLFFIAGVVYIQTHNGSINAINGFAKNNKVLSVSLAVSILSICGLPFTLGSLTKIQIFTISISHDIILMQITLLVSVVLTFLYLFRVFFKAFFCLPSKNKIDKITFNGYNLLSPIILLISFVNVGLFFLMF